MGLPAIQTKIVLYTAGPAQPPELFGSQLLSALLIFLSSFTDSVLISSSQGEAFCEWIPVELKFCL